MWAFCVSYRNVLKCTKRQLTAVTLHIQISAVDLEFTTLELLVMKLPWCRNWFMERECGKAGKPPLVIVSKQLIRHRFNSLN